MGWGCLQSDTSENPEEIITVVYLCGFAEQHCFSTCPSEAAHSLPPSASSSTVSPDPVAAGSASSREATVQAQTWGLWICELAARLCTEWFYRRVWQRVGEAVQCGAEAWVRCDLSPQEACQTAALDELLKAPVLFSLNTGQYRTGRRN